MSTAKITKSAGVMGIAIAISRVLGLVRDQVFAFFFGSSAAAEAFIVAFRIPNLLRDLFAEGALSQAYVPVITHKIMQKGEAAGWRLANLVLNWQLAILVPLTILGMVYASDVVELIAGGAGGFTGQKFDTTVELTRIMFPFIVLVSVAAVFMGTLNVRHIFFVPASASSMFNITSILVGVLAGYLIDPHFGPAAIVGWAIATLAGGFMQMAIQVPSLWREGYRYEPVFSLRDSGIHEVWRRALPGIIAASAIEVNVLVTTYFASHLEDGSVAWLNYSLRLAYLPIGLFGVGIGTAALPSLSRSVSERNLTQFRTQFNHSLRLAMCFAVPSAIGMAIISPLLISVLFERGRFSAADTVETARVLRFYVAGLVGYAALKVIVPAFYALGRASKPMFVSFMGIAVNFILCSVFTSAGPLDFGWIDLRTRGLALATSCSAVLNACILLLLLRSLLEKRMDFHETIGGLMRVLLASGIMAGAVYGLMKLFEFFRLPHLLWSDVLQLALLVSMGACVFMAAARFLNIQEVREMTDLVLKKFHGRSTQASGEN